MPEPGDPPSLETFSDGDLHIDFTERLVIYDVRPASLRNRFELIPAEAAVLARLVQYRNEALSGAQLGEQIWGDVDGRAAAKRIISLILRLQRKLGDMDLPKCPVETIPGVGYRYRTMNP